MPFYEYQCQACGAQVEVLQKISDAPLKKCPECGKSKLTKLISAPVFRLKGGGWYETDFKSEKDGRRNLAGAEKDAGASDGEPKPAAAAPAAADATPKPAPAGDAKPAEKTAAKPAASPAAKQARRSDSARTKAKPAKRAAAKGHK